MKISTICPVDALFTICICARIGAFVLCELVTCRFDIISMSLDGVILDWHVRCHSKWMMTFLAGPLFFLLSTGTKSTAAHCSTASPPVVVVSRVCYLLGAAKHTLQWLTSCHN